MSGDEKVNPLSLMLAMLKDAFTVMREFLLLILFVILLFFPRSLNLRLSQAGLTKIEGGVFTWQQQKQIDKSVDQSKAAAQANSAATDSLNDAKATITALASQTTNQSVKSQAKAALEKVDGSLSSLRATDQSLKTSLVTQQAILQTVANTAGQPASSAAETPTQGWVYLGEMDAAGKSWIIPPEPRIPPNSPMPNKGQIVTLTDDVYLRADKGPGQTFSQAAITRAVPSGTAVTVTDVQLSSALNGGKFIWAKVTVKSGQ